MVSNTKPLGWIALAAFLILTANGLRAEPVSITLYAASSLRDLLTQASGHEDLPDDLKITLVFGASSALARQIERGAPADLFFSASDAWVDYLTNKGLTTQNDDSALISNRLVFIAGPGSDIRHADPNDLAALLSHSRLAIGDPDHVPAGIYAKAALQSLGIWPQIAHRTIQTNDVRTALAYVARGDAPFGIVYRTDALIEPDVRILAELDPALHPEIRYPLTIVSSSKNPKSAARARQWFQRAAFMELATALGFEQRPGPSDAD